ncbi:hypothetical protein K458DRAFT_478262 [Lentithecium fluviatile CBS 122367]|uniref:Uncharacterized protein n=1 Tax=Lentithecium fluviatile CBS 122367 TaxID=1168545 RepID=A0A6G1IYX4_9PLEO|nr:hypothetical protein K458DRAFT_478262 [Lentithecium fluviatile CBS 122367]
MSSSQPPPPIHNVLLTIPRTASHLLTQLLNLPAQLSIIRSPNRKDGYLFLSVAAQRFRNKLTERPASQWTEEEKQGLQDAFQTGFDDWVALIEEAERQGKGTYVKEHVHWLVDPVAEERLLEGVDATEAEKHVFKLYMPFPNDSPIAESNNLDNITTLPTPFFSHLSPTFIIRHPALTFPSCLRTTIDIEGLPIALSSPRTQAWECTYSWTLSLYNFYAHHPSFPRATRVKGVTYPIVIDAADLVDEGLVRVYAKAVGFDEECVRFEWGAAGEEEVGRLGAAERRMKSSILGSRGVESGKLGLEHFHSFIREISQHITKISIVYEAKSSS